MANALLTRGLNLLQRRGVESGEREKYTHGHRALKPSLFREKTNKYFYTEGSRLRSDSRVFVSISPLGEERVPTPLWIEAPFPLPTSGNIAVQQLSQCSAPEVCEQF